MLEQLIRVRELTLQYWYDRDFAVVDAIEYIYGEDHVHNVLYKRLMAVLLVLRPNASMFRSLQAGGDLRGTLDIFDSLEEALRHDS